MNCLPGLCKFLDTCCNYIVKSARHLDGEASGEPTNELSRCRWQGREERSWDGAEPQTSTWEARGVELRGGVSFDKTVEGEAQAASPGPGDRPLLSALRTDT